MSKLREYKVKVGRSGTPTTMRLTEADAKRLGGEPVPVTAESKKRPAPKGKSAPKQGG